MAKLPLTFSLVFALAAGFTPGWPTGGVLAAEFPLLEDYVYAGQGDEFVQLAQRFLQDNPGSPMAPRVALDLMTVGKVAGAQALVDAERGRLLFEYGNSVQARYVTTTFENADGLRQFLTKQADERLRTHADELPRQFTDAVLTGRRTFADKLFEDAGFRLQCYVMAQIADEANLVTWLGQRLEVDRLMEKRLPPVINACLQPGSGADRVLTLHAHREMPVARFLEGLLLDRLTQDEQARPDIRELCIENAINESEFDRAQRLLAALPEEAAQAPRVLMWLARVAFAQGQDTEALATLSLLEARHPGSPWTTVGRGFAERIRTLDANTVAYATALETAVARLTSEAWLFEASAVYAPTPTGEPARKPVRIHLCCDDSKRFFELDLSQDDKPVFGYRTEGTQSVCWSAAEPSIMRFLVPGPIPSGEISLTQEPTGRFLFNLSYQFNSGDGKAGSAIAGLFTSPFLSTRDGLSKLIASTARIKGWCPEAVVTTDGAATFAWIGLDTVAPETDRFEIALKANGSFASIRGRSLAVEGIRHGRADMSKATPMAWPDMPVVTQPKMDPQAFMRIFFGVASLVTGE